MDGPHVCPDVKELKPTSVLKHAGVRTGDIVVAVNGEAVAGGAIETTQMLKPAIPRGEVRTPRPRGPNPRHLK